MRRKTRDASLQEFSRLFRKWECHAPKARSDARQRRRKKCRGSVDQCDAQQPPSLDAFGGAFGGEEFSSVGVCGHGGSPKRGWGTARGPVERGGMRRQRGRDLFLADRAEEQRTIHVSHAKAKKWNSTRARATHEEQTENVVFGSEPRALRVWFRPARQTCT